MDNMPQFWPWNQLDEDQAKHVLNKALHHAEDGEVFFERLSNESLSLSDGRIRTSHFGQSEGFGLRAVKGEFTAYAYGNELELPALLNACECVTSALEKSTQAIQDISTQQGTAPTARDDLYAPLNPTEEADFAAKVAMLQAIDDYARSRDLRVIQVQAMLNSTCQEVCIMPHHGPLGRDTRPMVRLSVQVIVQSNARRETGSSGGGGRYSVMELLDEKTWQAHVDEALRIALVNLGAEDCPSGQQDIVIGSGWPGILLHEAIGHGLEGDAHRKSTSVFTHKMGKRIASKGVNIYDDGTLPLARGSIHIDDEGTIAQKNPLIEDGILVGLMQDRQNARLMGAKDTGNGRRQSYRDLPMPRMTNTYMSAGESTTEALLADLKDGIYAVGFGGGQVDVTSGKFVFSCTEAYRVKNGQIGAPLKGATLIGDGATALRNIEAIGNDFKIDPGMGTCGKQGQWVPVTVGQPSLYISGLTVGGTD